MSGQDDVLPLVVPAAVPPIAPVAAPLSAKPARPIKHHHRMLFNVIKDDYILGVIARKMDLTRLLKKRSVSLRDDDERSTLFARGVKDAPRTPWDDVAEELYHLRATNEKEFNRRIHRLGDERFKALHAINVFSTDPKKWRSHWRAAFCRVLGELSEAGLMSANENGGEVDRRPGGGVWIRRLA